MRLSYFAKIVLRSVTSGGSAATLYVSTHGGHRNNGSSVVYFPPVLTLGTALTSEFGKANDPYQVPARLMFTIRNKGGAYDNYLPNGSSAQYWDKATVTLYEGDATIDGATLASMTVAFTGKIAPSSMAFGEDYIEFDTYDIRVDSNQPVCTQVWSQHAGYVAGGAGVVPAGQPIPVILGDWTTTSARLPAYMIAVSGSNYVYAICNHACTTLTVYDSAGNTITPSSTANFATRGEFTCTTAADADYQVGEALFVICKGHTASLTDTNHVRLIQFILTQFGGLATTDIYNPLADATNNLRGSFRVLYADTGSASPEYPAHFYVADSSMLALNLAAKVAYDCNCYLTVVNNQYRIYWETPQVAVSVTTIADRYLVENPKMLSDPDQEFCTVIRADYDYDPSDTEYLGKYDTAASLTSGPIDDQRDVYRGVSTQTITKEDVVLAEQYTTIYDASTAGRTAQRRLFWRVRVPQLLEATFMDDRQNGDRLSLTLFKDFYLQRASWDSQPHRILSLSKNVQTGAVTVRGLALNNLPQIGMWTDASGNDAGGNPVASYWGDANGLDSSGNFVGAWL